MEGWIKLHRSITDNWIWDDKPFTRGQAFVDLLLDVNHADNKVLINGQLVEVKAGEKITSLHTLAERYGWSIKKVRNFLDMLEKDGMIVRKRAQHYTIVKVQNYGIYQGYDLPEGHTKGTQKAHKGHTEGIQRATNKNDIRMTKNNNNTLSIPSVEDVRAYCAERKNEIDADEFVDFYQSKGWMVGKNKMKDWKAAVRTWERSRKQKTASKWNGSDNQYEGQF